MTSGRDWRGCNRYLPMDTLDRLKLNVSLVERLLTDFIYQEVTRTGIQHAVIGLSGGVDSALAATLSAKALGPENVLALILPYRTSNPESRADAEEMVRQLHIQSRVIDITPMVDPYLEQYVHGDAKRRGNVMARERMLILYDQSEEFHALVIGTSNKTEALLGYTTQFGDNAAALHPLGDLYKTQVWQLAEAMGVPPNIVKKAPSADLWAGQTDEGELGFTYATADQILYLLVDERRRPEEIVAMGFDERVIREIERRIQRNHFKRVMPPVAKLGPRTIGTDFLYSRDWGT